MHTQASDLLDLCIHEVEGCLLSSTSERTCLLDILVNSQSPCSKTVNSISVPDRTFQKERACVFVMLSRT